MLCALATIVIVALWFMFTGSITLKWSAGNLNQFSDDLDSMILEDLDVLEVEEREKVVKHMWDVYTRSQNGLSQFWLEAFEAGYEHLISDVPAVKNAAVSEIAKMSLALRSHISHQLPLQLQSPSHVKSSKISRKLKQANTQSESDH
nr:uncharacterized protein LOC101512645 isoform X2 [Cicer arietinum]